MECQRSAQQAAEIDGFILSLSPDLLGVELYRRRKLAWLTLEHCKNALFSLNLHFTLLHRVTYDHKVALGKQVRLMIEGERGPRRLPPPCLANPSSPPPHKCAALRAFLFPTAPQLCLGTTQPIITF